MRVATQMQDGRVRRAIALLLAGCMVFAGLAALRHEATVAHAHGALTGELEHTHALADYHEQSTTPHLHGRNVDAHGDTGACHLLAALTKSSIVAESVSFMPLAAATNIAVPAPLVVELTTSARYRLAPKTSPPALV